MTEERVTLTTSSAAVFPPAGADRNPESSFGGMAKPCAEV